MGNIKNFNFNKLDLKLSNSDYWDFYLATDEGPISDCDGLTSGTCFVVWYDFNNSEIYPTGTTSGTSIYSLVTWDDAVNTGYTMNTIGLTGIDNGLITFDTVSGDTTNQVLLSALTGTTLVIPSGETRLLMTRVTGTTGNYIYPMDIIIDPTGTIGDYANFCGGFYQGYYKLDGNSYEVLPVRVSQAWSAEFWLNPSSSGCTGYTGTTLNDAYPNNKGFFFYMGTRAENKFWNTFEGVDSGCTSGCTSGTTGCTDTLSPWCTLPRETDIILEGGEYGVGIPLSPPLINIDLITNGFLIYGRARSGNTGSCGSCGGPQDGHGNQTACSFTGFTQDQTTLDYNIDIIDNALGFRITDDGRIGYRLLNVTGTCITNDTERVYVSGVTVEEEYSASGMVSSDEWSYIVLRFVMEYKDECQLRVIGPRKGKLMVYRNAKLIHVFNDFDELVARRLNDNMLKQVGVPFNMSLGGGSQGLLESMSFDGLDMDDRGLPIETNFAGTFIGGISQFKFNICDLAFCDIQNNYANNAYRYSSHSRY